MFVINDEGWTEGALRLKSPHFNERPSVDVCPQTVVLHNITLPPGQFATGMVEDLFLGRLECSRDPRLEDLRGLRVSSHFFITRTGVLEQFVSCSERAWHAGVSRFNGRDNCNDFTLGIELEGTDFVPFENEQYQTLVSLLQAIDAKYGLAYIVGHSDIAPGRKTDPGPCFDWVRLYRSRQQFGNPEFAGAAARMQLSRLRQTFECA